MPLGALKTRNSAKISNCIIQLKISCGALTFLSLTGPKRPHCKFPCSGQLYSQHRRERSLSGQFSISYTTACILTSPKSNRIFCPGSPQNYSNPLENVLFKSQSLLLQTLPPTHTLLLILCSSIVPSEALHGLCKCM